MSRSDGWGRDGVGRLQQAPDVADEVALEATDRFARALAFGPAPRDVVPCRWMAAGAGDDDAMKRGVDLAVAALVEPLALHVARAGWDGATPAARASLAG